MRSLALIRMVPLMQVCIDLFVLAQSYVDVASLKELCHQTAGSLYHYHPFHPAADGEQFWNDLRWSVVRPQVLCFLHAVNPCMRVHSAPHTALLWV